MSELVGKSNYAKAIAEEMETHGPALKQLAEKVVAFRTENIDKVGPSFEQHACAASHQSGEHQLYKRYSRKAVRKRPIRGCSTGTMPRGSGA
eukprot:4051208-Pyramimonas_sp.AAC.2